MATLSSVDDLPDWTAAPPAGGGAPSGFGGGGPPSNFGQRAGGGAPTTAPRQPPAPGAAPGAGRESTFDIPTTSGQGKKPVLTERPRKEDAVPEHRKVRSDAHCGTVSRDECAPCVQQAVEIRVLPPSESLTAKELMEQRRPVLPSASSK